MSGKLPSLRRVNLLYAMVQMIYWAAFAAFAGYQTALLLGRGFSSGDAGVFASIRCFAGILAQPILGGWADRHPKVPLKIILECCLGLSLAVNALFYCIRPDFAGTALIFLILGILELNAYPLLDSMAVQFINAGLNMNYSLGRGLGSFSYAVSCVLLGRQSAALGVETVLVTHTALLAVLMLVIAAYPTAPVMAPAVLGADSQPHSVRYILKSSRSFTLMLAAAFFSLTAVMPIVSFMVNIVTDRGGTEGELGLALFLMAASELPAAFLFQFLWRQFGAQWTLAASVLFMALKPVAFLLAPSLGWVLAVQPIQMLGYGLFTPAAVYFANDNVPLADRVRGQSLMMMASNGLGGVVGNFLAGFFIDYGSVNAMLMFCAVCGALGVVLATASVRCGKKNGRNPV